MSLRVGTWNVYVGAPFEDLLGSVTVDGLAGAGADMVDRLRASRYAERAAVIGEVIDTYAPDLVGLNELSRWQLGVGSDVIESADLETELVGALAYAGAPYRLVASVERIAGGVPLDADRWASITVRDAVLLRADDRNPIELADLTSGQYERLLTIELGGELQVPVPRGWIRATVVSGDGPVDVVVTHLESVDAAVRRAQAAELANLIAASRQPCILLGDLNAPSWMTGDGDLAALGDVGLVDAWAYCHPHDPGFTWSPADLGAARAFERRIDFVAATDDLVPVACRIVGTEEDIRTGGSPRLPPSDHAGVIATYERRAAIG